MLLSTFPWRCLGAALRRPLALLGVTIFGLGALQPVHAKVSNEVQTGQTPSWVAPVKYAPVNTNAQDTNSDGVSYLLSDVQVRIEAQQQSSYRHFASQAINGQGVEKIGNISIGFDPAYQTLSVSRIAVHRNGQVFDKLPDAHFKVLQRERELEYLIYDGSKTASVFLEDIRVGDVVEYAYTLTGSNPVFNNRAFGQADLQWGIPVGRIFARVLAPIDRVLIIKQFNSAPKAKLSEQDGYRDYRWDLSAQPGKVVESDAPGWFDPYPNVQWSEFADWPAVAQWALPLYRVPDRLPPAMQAEVDKIARQHADISSRIVAVLKLVQSEVRYLGVEVGPGSHAPNSPELVFKRRFGDCKDKALLTITLLQALGIKAVPALVDTNLKRGITNRLPTPGAFNHVIVAIQAQDGSYYWLDPTRSPQKGNLASIYQPDFGKALLVTAQTSGLTDMTPMLPHNNRQVVAEFNASAGFEKPVSYSITTTTEGADAESTRSMLAAQTKEELQKNYLNYYARYYPDIRVKTPFTVVDDEAANIITVTEHYVIGKFWPHNAEAKRLEGTIEVPDLLDYLRRPDGMHRNAPLAIRYPATLTHVTKVHLPVAWELESSHEEARHAAFTFTRDLDDTDKTVTLTDHYVALADSVAAEDMERYISKLNEARNIADLSLYHYDNIPAAAPKPHIAKPASTASGFNLSIALLGVMLLALWTWLASQLYRYNPPARSDQSLRPRNFGGWLLLPMVGLSLTPLRLLQVLIDALPVYTPGSWFSLTYPGGNSYHPLWEAVLLFELGANLALLVYSVLVVVLLYQKRSSFPYLATGYFALNLVTQLIDIALTSRIPAAITADSHVYMTAFQTLLVLLIWGSYLCRSQRVSETFLLPYPSKSDPAAAPTAALVADLP